LKARLIERETQLEMASKDLIKAKVRLMRFKSCIGKDLFP